MKTSFKRIVLIIVTTAIFCLLPIYTLLGILFVFGDETSVYSYIKCEAKIEDVCLLRGFPLIYQQGENGPDGTFFPTTNLNYFYFIVDLIIFMGIPTAIMFLLIKKIKAYKPIK